MNAFAYFVLVFSLAQSPTTAPAETQSASTRPAGRPAWVPLSDGPWNNNLAVLVVRDGKPLATGSPPQIERASAPTDLAREGDRYLAIFEYFSNESAKDFGCLAESESKDAGRTWSSPKRLQIRGLAADDGRPRSPSLATLPDGRIRLYVTLYPRHGRSVISSLISKDGKAFEAESDRRLALPDANLLDPIVVQSDNSVHLFARQGGHPRELVHAVSKDGLRFDRLPDIRLDAALAQTPAVREGAFIATPRGVLFVGTNDGSNWSVSSVHELPPALDIASARMKSGDRLVILVPDTRRGPDGKLLSMGRRRDAANPGQSPDGPTPAGSTDSSAVDEPGDPNAIDAWPPEPDFLSPIDYVAWLRDRGDARVTDNAQPYYFQFMMKQDGDGHWVSALPQFAGMLNNVNFDGDPAPWRPDDQPEWEQSFQTALPYFTQYRAATAHDGYTTNVLLDPDAKGPALMNFLLPDLSVHRMICKEILSASWRAPDGKPDPSAMISAWQTTLTSAKHLQSGVTLIEQLVGTATTNVTYSDARQALAQGVIPPDRLEDALKTLREYAPKPRDPSELLVGEAAFAADIIQYVTDLNTPDGKPRFSNEKIMEVAPFFSDKPVQPEVLDEVLKKDPREVSQALRNYYRDTADAMRVGYPEVSAAKLNEITERYTTEHSELSPILPALGRAEAIMTRNEASRRATELAYEVNIFKARQGRWPASLDELPASQTGDSRTDPFTKRDFLYRVGPNGPVIYSASENGKDDGGVHSARWGDDKQKDGESDDYVFWPPQPKPKRK